MFNNSFNTNDSTYNKAVAELTFERAYELFGKDAGLDKEEQKEIWMERAASMGSQNVNAREETGGSAEFYVVCFILAILSVGFFIKDRKDRKEIHDILKRKGYDEDFEKEFMRGMRGTASYAYMWHRKQVANELASFPEIEEEESNPQNLMRAASGDWWVCKNCGKANTPYVGTCGCGCDKSGEMRK